MLGEREKEMYEAWIALWNGERDACGDLVDEDCKIHQAPFGPGEQVALTGPEGVLEMVQQARRYFETLTFDITVGPFQEGDLLAARWSAKGVYKGGLPGATAPAETPVSFCGIDIWRITDGKVAEYWTSSDGAHLMAQLGMLAAAPAD